MKTKQEQIINELESNMRKIFRSKLIIRSAKEQLKRYGITEGRVEQVLNNPKMLLKEDIREAILFSDVLLYQSRLLHPSDAPYTRNELVESRQYYRSVEVGSDEGDIVLKNVIEVGEGVFVTTVKPKEIAKMLRRQMLYYNHEIQRQGRYIKRNNEVIKTPTINQGNVREMKELLLRRQLLSTTIAFNTAVGSSDTGREFLYNKSDGTFTISADARVDILDGFHRCLASKEAFEEDEDLGDFSFILRLSNYTTREAQKYQAQLAKATPIPKARQQELASERLADIVIRHLRADSEIGEKISSSNRISSVGGELVSYNVIADAIEREFPMQMRIETREVSEWLAEFFEYLLGSFPSEFTGDQRTKQSIMGHSRMFSGYIALASKMKSENTELKNLKTVLEKVDFSRGNPLWQRLGLLDENGNISRSVNAENIADYFKSLNTKESEEIK